MLKVKGTDYSLTSYITKKAERLKSYELVKKENPKLRLEDFIKSSWVRYEIKTNGIKDLKASKTKDGKTIAINQDVVENEISKILSKIKISKEKYNEYVNFVNSRMNEILKKNQEERSQISMRL